MVSSSQNCASRQEAFKNSDYGAHEVFEKAMLITMPVFKNIALQATKVFRAIMNA